MKFTRTLAIVPLGLVSLFNVGYPFGSDPKPHAALGAAVLALGVAGFVAAYGLARHATWAGPAALTVTAINVVAAIVALASDTEGATVGLVLSAVALVLVVVASSPRNVSVA
jgi:hypothetical protein